MDPKSSKGAIMWIVTGFFAGLVALLIGYFIPSIIPAGATQTKL